MKARFLRRDERSYVLAIFGKTIPLDDILITDGGGSNESLEPLESPTGRNKYCLPMGRRGFTSCTSMEMRSTFVHGLTHVWQRRHCAAKAAARCQGASAPYEIGKPWRHYTPEQQARLVADWVQDGMSDSDPRAAYVMNHIQTGAI